MKTNEQTIMLAVATLLTAAIIVVVIFVLSGGSPEKIFDVFRAIFAAIWVYLFGGLKSILR